LDIGCDETDRELSWSHPLLNTLHQAADLEEGRNRRREGGRRGERGGGKGRRGEEEEAKRVNMRRRVRRKRSGKRKKSGQRSRKRRRERKRKRKKATWEYSLTYHVISYHVR
jgi:hypothetical protein